MSTQSEPAVISDTSVRLRRLKNETRIALGLGGLACVLTLLAGLEAQREIQEARSDLQKQVVELDATNRQARALAGQAQEVSHDLETRMVGLENRIADAQAQQTALEALYRDLSINQEDTALVEIEQAVAVANQQLLLAGDVHLAIRAMENASRRMERIDRPALLGLRRIIDEDLRRLRAVPVLDQSGMSLRIDTLASVSDTLPLAAFARPPKPVAQANPAAQSFWSKVGARLLDELGQAVRIQRTEGANLPPLAPEQAFFLRQTLKLRLLTARQALLAHDETTFRSDLRQALHWLETYYDRQDRNVQKSVDALHALVDSSISISVPDVSASLTAVRDARAVRESHNAPTARGAGQEKGRTK